MLYSVVWFNTFFNALYIFLIFLPIDTKCQNIYNENILFIFMVSLILVLKEYKNLG